MDSNLRKSDMAAPDKMIMIFVILFLFGLAPDNLLSSSDADPNQQFRLEPCSQAPNCVSSLGTEKFHFIEPLRYAGTFKTAYHALKSVIESHPRARIVEDRAPYLHAEFESRVFGFVDDVEFLFSENQNLIHVRSASRKGYFDFGVNRKRIEVR